MSKQLSYELDIVSNSIFIELVENLLETVSTKVWLEKIVNLLKQLLSAKYVCLTTFIDNLIVTTANVGALCTTPLHEGKYRGMFLETQEPFWSDNSYIVPLSVEGYLEIIWDKAPSNTALNNFNNIFSLVAASLRNRASTIAEEKNITLHDNLSKIVKLLGSDLELKNKISFLTKEIGSSLNSSRCQVKIFSQDATSNFDSTLSAEFATSNFLGSISVIPNIEKEWIEKIKKEGFLILDHKEDSFSKDFELLLSIRSILGYPLFYKAKPIGVLILHQCDHGREWKSNEISYIKQITLLLSILVGSEIELKEKLKASVTDLNSGVLNSDEFLRKLNHLQVESQVSNLCFSLLMIDIEKLKDINLHMGFVAGNLILSQTARYINRLFGNSYEIARYNNDEFVIIMKGVSQNKARSEAEKLKSHLSNVIVLGVGPVDYNFSFVTFPTHTGSIAELLVLLEQGMILSKSRGKSQISSFDEVQGKSKGRWQALVTNAIPEIILKKSSLKTGPEIIETIKKQVLASSNKAAYSADILDAVQSLALALDAKDSYTEGHSKRVSEYAYMLAKSLDLDLQEIEWIRLAASMHDIGKIGIPESILCKPDKLTKEEFEVMKKHPVIGARILNPIKPLEKVANLVLYHHEYWDGSGYPNKLSKNEIPLGARIVCIVDAFQAMTSNRPYRATLPQEEAIKRLRDGKEKQWDPELVELFIKMVLT